MERSDVGTTGRLLFSVKSALAKPACGYGFKRLVGYTDAFMYGLRASARGHTDRGESHKGLDILE